MVEKLLKGGSDSQPLNLKLSKKKTEPKSLQHLPSMFKFLHSNWTLIALE